MLDFRWFPAVFSLRVVLEFCAGRRGGGSVKFWAGSVKFFLAARGPHAPPPAAARVGDGAWPTRAAVCGCA